MLTFTVDKQILKRTDTDKTIADSVKYLTATFTFSEDWTGTTKTVLFNHETVTYAMILESDTCVVPWEVIHSDYFRVSVYGVKDDERITTNNVTVYVGESGYREGGEPQPPTPSQIEQILQILSNLTGGAANKVLAKKSSQDYDFKWVNNEGGGGGGSSVEWEQILKSGTKIATITIDSESYDVYAPTPFSGDYDDLTNQPTIPSALADLSSDTTHRTVSDADITAWNGKSIVVCTQELSTGTLIGTITINGTPVNLYAPSGSGGDTVSWTQILSSGTKIGTITINGTATDVYAPSGSAEAIPNFRWQEESGTIYEGSLYSITGKEVWDRDASLFTCLEYTFTGNEQKLKVSGQDCGMNYYRSYAIVDDEYNLLAEPTEPWQNGRTDSNLLIDIPDGAYKIFLNGANYQAPYLEVALIDVRSDLSTLDKFLKGISEKIKYRKTFAWKPMPTGLFAFTFDDSIAETDQIVDDMIDVGAPACFGAVSSHLNMTCSNTTETITQAMQRMINSAYGGEVLNHGGYTVTIANIDDLNYLYEKFVIDRQKFRDVGFDVRGIVRSGESDGQGNPCLDNDPRTDVWVRLLYDYSDLYGIHEPYNHARYSIASNSTLADMKAMVDSVIQNKTFCPILFHNPYTLNWDFKELAEYILDQGGQIVTYAYAYDNYGSDAETVDILRRITALESGSTPTLTSITASKTTVAYSVGDQLNISDITVTAHYSDSSSEDVTSSATINANNVDMSTAGTYSISVSYLTASTTISITVSAVAKVLDSISAVKAITSYEVGASLDTTDITVTAHYTDSTSTTVAGTYDTSNVNMSTAGTYSIGVSYTENGVTKTTSVSITVTSVSYIIDHATASGSALAHNSAIGPEFAPTSGKTYHVEFDYDFTATTQYSAHTIKVQPYGWAYTDIVVIDAVTGSNTGHASADVTAINSNPVANLLKVLLQNTSITAYSLTNICVWEV